MSSNLRAMLPSALRWDDMRLRADGLRALAEPRALREVSPQVRSGRLAQSVQSACLKNDQSGT